MLSLIIKGYNNIRLAFASNMHIKYTEYRRCFKKVLYLGLNMEMELPNKIQNS